MEYIKQKNSFFYRSCARLFDYSLFFLFGTSISLLFPYSPDLYFNFLFPLLIPILWAPLEAFLIACCGSTPGKMFFGLSVKNENGQKLSFKDALKRSCFLKIRPGTMQRSTLGLARRIFGVVLILMCLFGGLFGIVLKNFDRLNDPFGNLPGWVNYSAVDDRFAVDFPKDPQFKLKQLDVPKAGKSIDYQEYSAESKNIHYSVSYVDFPSKWKLFGYSTLLKKSLELMVAHDKEPQELISKTPTTHKNFPALDFIIKKGEQDIHGRLVLVGSTLYKLAVTYPQAAEQKLDHVRFLESFELLSNK